MSMFSFAQKLAAAIENGFGRFFDVKPFALLSSQPPINPVLTRETTGQGVLANHWFERTKSPLGNLNKIPMYKLQIAVTARPHGKYTIDRPTISMMIGLVSRL